MLLNPPLPLFLLCPPFPFCPFFSYVRSLIAASTSSWTRSTAFTMWLRCWRSSSGTCPTLFWPRSSTRPSSTPHVGFMFPLFPPLCLTLILLFKKNVFLPSASLCYPIHPNPCCSVGSRRAAECHSATGLPAPSMQQWYSPPPPGVSVHRDRPRPRQAGQRRAGGERQFVSAGNTTQKFSSSNPWVKCLLCRI